MTWVFLAVAAVAIVYLAVRLRVHGRYDRLLLEVERTRLVLERRLQARAVEALHLASSGALDPASSVLVADLATAALGDDGTAGRAVRESALSSGLRAVLSTGPEGAVHPHGSAATGPLLAAWDRVVVARMLHNSRVTQARDLRDSRTGRIVALGGDLPATFDMDDVPPHNWEEPPANRKVDT